MGPVAMLIAQLEEQKRLPGNENHTLMSLHVDLWAEEADEYTPGDHAVMIAVAKELLRREEEAS